MKKPVSGVPTGPDTNRAVQPQKMATGLKYSDLRSRGIALSVAKTKPLISCAFVFAYANSRVSHDAAQIMSFGSGGVKSPSCGSFLSFILFSGKAEASKMGE